MTLDSPQPRFKHLRTFAIVMASVFVVGFLFRLTEAGSLTPTALPATTMKTLEDIFNPLVSSSYDSSGVAPDRNGNVLEVAKCIMARMTGGVCPGTLPSITAIDGLTAGLQITQSIAIQMSDFINTISGTVNRYKMVINGTTTVEGTSSGISYTFTCAELGTNTVEIFACNGALCDSDVSFPFDIQDNFMNPCP